MIIRDQIELDNTSIEKITIDAFKNHKFSSNTEQFIIRDLRRNDNLPVSLVAETDGVVVGHVAFSAVNISCGTQNWFGLGPISVSPPFQNNGIGSKLILAGLEEIKKLGANGCVVLGEPEFYSRFGFQFIEQLIYEGVPPTYFQAQLFSGVMASGKVSYDIAFQAKS